MLGSKTQYSLKNAESYFREHLKVGDYYMEGRTVSGEWIGDGAKKLNLSGVATEKDFINLCRNVNPQTGEQLTPRMNGKRISVDKNGVSHEYANRRVFFDFTISPPKSVSIAALVGNDKRIIEAHDKAVRLAMSQFEVFAATRVRLDGQYDYRRTFNLVGAVFRHDTSRAFMQGNTGKLRGVTDKHLLVESGNCIRPVPFKHLDKITVCQPKELSLSTGERLQLKANDKSQDGRKLANGELVTVKEIHPDGRIALNDGRVLPTHYRQFVRGYAVTSYAAQGKTVDYILFSDSAVKAATNQNQWYVTISRGRKGVKIFTADKIQLRENVARSGERTLALDMAQNYFHKLAAAWGNEAARTLEAQHSQRLETEEKQREREARELPQLETIKESLHQKQGKSAKQTETDAQKILRRSKIIRRGRDFVRRQNIQRGRGIGI
jgi:hypothetical protein